MHNSPREEQGDRKREDTKSQLPTVFLPRLECCFLFDGEGGGLSGFRFRNQLPKNDSAAKTFRGLRLVLELAFRALHWVGIIPAQNPSLSPMSLRILGESVTRF